MTGHALYGERTGLGAVQLDVMVLRTDDARAHWANDHRPLAGALFGLGTAVIVAMPVAISGVPWRGTFLIALGAGMIVGLIGQDYRRLLALRDGLRRFLRWSEERAKAVGLTAPQHQLLLAICGHGSVPSIGEVTAHLLLRHRSVVELVERAVAAGMVERSEDAEDHRIVRLALTAQGREKVAALAAAHLEELSRLRPQFESLWERLPELAS